MIIKLDSLFEHQRKLDQEIHRIHHQSYKIVSNKITLALATELGELANEVRCFKFWSLKSPSAPDVILEEYADGLHFITSKAIFLKIQPTFVVNKTEVIFDKEILTLMFNELFFMLSKLNSKTNVKKWYEKYLELGFALGFNEDKILAAYDNKNAINHQRQINNY